MLERAASDLWRQGRSRSLPMSSSSEGPSPIRANGFTGFGSRIVALAAADPFLQPVVYLQLSRLPASHDGPDRKYPGTTHAEAGGLCVFDRAA
jgi:hypothetical protein